MNLKPLLLLLLLASIFACQKPAPTEPNPPAPGFDLTGSDPRAIAIADEVMEAMGGRQAWDEARFFTWVFFDFRKLWWDKQTGDVRIESYPDSSVYLMNVNTLQGKFQTKGRSETDPDSLKIHLKRGKSIWINDSYWLLMPFKLKDSGVTLKYVGESKTQTGQAADVLSLTFTGVGDTPQNKYHVFVDTASHLVRQWSFFRNAQQDTANFTTPWDGYEQYGPLLLGGDRGERKLSEISVEEDLPKELFLAF